MGEGGSSGVLIQESPGTASTLLLQKKPLKRPQGGGGEGVKCGNEDPSMFLSH